MGSPEINKKLCSDCGLPLKECACAEIAKAEYEMTSKTERERQEAEAEEAELAQQQEDEAKYFNGEEPEEYDGEEYGN
jgi:hypothetical protein